MVNQPYSEGMSGDYTIPNTSDSFVALYEYNCSNQLVGVDTNGVVSSYAYAPYGLRHSKTVGGNTTTFVYDNTNVVEEITADGINKYYRGIEIIKNSNDLYYLYNGQGDVSLLVDNARTTVADYVFDAYGNQSEENTISNLFGYRGEYQDLCSGLIYLRNRYYDPSIGRFITEDPARDGLNWYVYCENNPVNRIDPSGLDSYVYYDPNMEAGQEGYMTKDEAEYYKLLSEKAYGTKTHLIPVSNAKKFRICWNNMGIDVNGNEMNIDAVYILLHGTVAGKSGEGVGYMYFANGDRIVANDSAIKDWNNDITVDSLYTKEMELLYLSVCNSANPDTYNVTYAFMQQMNIRQRIVGWDGGTVFDYSDNTLKGGGYKSNQSTFNKHNITGRERYGKRVFDHTLNGWVELISSRTYPGRR